MKPSNERTKLEAEVKKAIFALASAYPKAHVTVVVAEPDLEGILCASQTPDLSSTALLLHCAMEQVLDSMPPEDQINLLANIAAVEGLELQDSDAEYAMPDLDKDLDLMSEIIASMKESNTIH